MPFGFLKATFQLQIGAGADAHALENLRAIASLATQQGDTAICVACSLLEGTAHLKAMAADVVERVQMWHRPKRPCIS